MQDFDFGHSMLSEHSILKQPTLGSPLAFPAHWQEALCPDVLQIAFSPQTPGRSHGFLHLESSQIAESGQSLSVKHSPAFLHPPRTGSPTSPSGHVQMKFPGVFLHTAVA